MHVSAVLRIGAGLVVLCWLIGGCTLLQMNDPNHNDKIRYSMALEHADRTLKESKSEVSLSEPKDYDMDVFYRRYYDESAHVIHDLALYDFLKISQKPGPERFVIAYDFATRKTYLRTDLRSNENIERLPSTQPAKE